MAACLSRFQKTGVKSKLPLMKNLLIIFAATLPLTPMVRAQVARELEKKTVAVNQQEDKEELLQRYHALYNAPGLTGRGLNRVYKGEHLSAIQFPVGGIGTGCIQYDGSAVPRYWQIFNNMGHDFIPNSFFAIRVKDQDDVAVRALQTKSTGIFKNMRSLEAVSSFPFLEYRFSDDIPAIVNMEVYNPFIPNNLQDSGIPAVFYRITVENPTARPLEINLLSAQQNAVGFTRLPLINREKSFADNFNFSVNRNPVEGNNADYYQGNTNTIVDEEGAKVLYMEGNQPPTHEHFGQMALFVVGDKALINASQGIAHWKDQKTLLNQFTKKGELKGKSKAGSSADGTTYSGALNVPIRLEPGEKRTVNFVLAWYFPNGKNGGFMDKWDAWGHGDWEGNGNRYAHHWKDVKELTRYIVTHHKRLATETEKFTETLYETNLPHWLVERLGNQLSILKSRTVFHDQDNYIGLWEGTGGVDGSCAGNCNHVWHYAQAHARLFPEVGRLIRNQALDAIKDNGQIPYRQPAGTPAFDGQCGDILGAYREHLMSSSNAWLKTRYPAIKKAMNYLVNTHDDDKDGWLSDASKHTTYDASMTGNPSFLASLYLAALRASEKMALAMDDPQQASEWKSIAEKAAALHNDSLWNGEYFMQIRGAKPNTDYENGCHADQLLGQWWADQLGLGNLYPGYKLKSAAEAILEYNFKSTLAYHDQGHRTFALPTEAGMVVTTWPGNDRTPYASGYSGEVWTTFEYTIGAALLKHHKVRDALTLLRSGYDRYDGKLRTGYIGDWGNFGFSGNPFGDDECGQFYARALSIWSVLLAAQGFEYNGPAQSIGFDPKWKPEDHVSFFSAAEGWGTFTQKRDGQKQENSLQVKHGLLRLRQVTLNTDIEAPGSVEARVNGEKIQAGYSMDKGMLVLDMNQQSMEAGETMNIIIKR